MVATISATRMREINFRVRAEVIGRRKKDRMAIRPKKKTEIRFDRLQRFYVRNVLSVIDRAFDNGGTQIGAPTCINRYSVAVALWAMRSGFVRMPRLWSKYTDYCVNGSSCALHGAMRDILSRNRSVLRHVSRRANRSRLNASSANGERQND